MIVVILGGIRFGLFTPTEAAAVAVAYALLLAGPVYRSLSARDLWNKLVQAAVVPGMVLFVVGAARLLGWVLAVMEAPQTLASLVVGMGGGQIGFLLLTILVFLPLGAILEGVPAVVMVTPILLPIARQLGIDPVHYGAVIVATQGISVFLPPVGVSLLVACSVGGVEPAEVARPLWPYLALMLALTVLVLTLSVWRQKSLIPGDLWIAGTLRGVTSVVSGTRRVRSSHQGRRRGRWCVGGRGRPSSRASAGGWRRRTG